MEESSYPDAVGTTLLFENDRVRVWEMVVDPGEYFDYHSHRHDHVIIYPQAATMRAQELGDPDWGIVQDAEPGFVLARTVGHARPLTPHRLKNVGDETVVHYIVELLEESPSESSSPWEHNDRGRMAPEGE